MNAEIAGNLFHRVLAGQVEAIASAGVALVRSKYSGVYRVDGDVPVFQPVRAPTAEQLQALLTQIIKRIMKLLTRRGYLIEEQGITYLADTDSDFALAPLQSAACTYRIVLGPWAGKKVLSLKTVPTQEPQVTAKRCVSDHGFSLHADVRCVANQRNQLERLCRYITRPAIANERLKRNSTDGVVLQLKSPYQDGTTHIVMSPLEFMQRLAALVPRPRLNLIRFDEIPPCISPFGLLARSKFVPDGFVMAYWRLTLNCDPRSFLMGRKTKMTSQVRTAKSPIHRLLSASAGPVCSNGCSISTSNTALTVGVI